MGVGYKKIGIKLNSAAGAGTLAHKEIYHRLYLPRIFEDLPCWFVGGVGDGGKSWNKDTDPSLN